MSVKKDIELRHHKQVLGGWDAHFVLKRKEAGKLKFFFPMALSKTELDDLVALPDNDDGSKQVDVIYVAAIPKDLSGIGRDIPAHVKLQWLDGMGRRNSRELDLPEAIIQEIGKLPNKE